MRTQEPAKYFDPAEVALLQDCFDSILARREMDRTSEEANFVAAALFKAYGSGVAEKDVLIQLADIPNDPGY